MSPTGRYRPLTTVLITVATCLLGWLLLVRLAFHHPDPDVAWIEASYTHKLSALEHIPAPRLIIVAGSSALFGINSARLQDTYQLPTYNLGVNAGMLTPYVLDRAQPAIQAHDIVLAPLEYSMYLWDGELNQGLIKHVISNDTAWIKQRPLIGTKILLEAPANYVLTQWLKPTPSIPTGTYGPHRVDAYGDQTLTSLNERTTSQFDHVLQQTPQPYTLDKLTALSNLSWIELQRFRDTIHAKQACVIFLPPPHAFDPSYLSLGFDNDFYTQLPAVLKQHGLYFLGQPHDFLYPKADFFDTDYHLTDEQRQRHTQSLIQLLGPDLNAHCQASRQLAEAQSSEKVQP